MSTVPGPTPAATPPPKAGGGDSLRDLSDRPWAFCVAGSVCVCFGRTISFYHVYIRFVRSFWSVHSRFVVCEHSGLYACVMLLGCVRFLEVLRVFAQCFDHLSCVSDYFCMERGRVYLFLLGWTGAGPPPMFVSLRGSGPRRILEVPICFCPRVAVCGSRER